MDSRDFESNLLKIKEEQFKEYVRIAANSRGLEPPKVKFWDGDCPYGGNDELAHIHVDSGIICVRKARLLHLNFDEIRDIAIHETTHLIEANHSAAFTNECNKTSLRMWRPPGGVYAGGGLDRTDKEEKKEKKSTQDKEKCNLLFCRKKRVLKQCPFCKLYFCDEHYKPKAPKMRNLNDPSYLLEKDDEQGHPDACYAVFIINEEERVNKQYREALQSLVLKAPKQKEIIIDLRKEEEDLKKKDKKPKRYKIKDYVEKPVAVVKECYYCNDNIRGCSYECKYCHQNFCKKHREVANHECKTLYSPSNLETKVKEEKPKEEEKKTEIKEEKETPKKIRKNRITEVIIITLLIILILLYTLQVTISKEIVVNETKSVLVSKNVTMQIHIKISFEDYFNQIDSYTVREVTLEGLLYNPIESSGNAGVYVYYIEDDYGRKVTLHNLTSNQKSLFVKQGTTPGIYAVQGTLRRRLGGLELTVSQISPAQRATQGIVKSVQAEENITEPVKKTESEKISLLRKIIGDL